MKKLIDADKLREQIEKLLAKNHVTDSYSQGLFYAYEKSIELIDEAPDLLPKKQKVYEYPFDVPNNDGFIVFSPMNNATIRKKFRLKKGERVIILIRKEKV